MGLYNDRYVHNELINIKQKPVHKHKGDADGVYLVYIVTFNKKENKLVYGYTYYPNIFLECLLNYFKFKNSYQSFNEWGNYTTISVLNKPEQDLVLDINQELSNYIKKHTSVWYRNLRAIKIEILIKILLKRYIFLADINKVSLLIDLAFKKDIDFLKELLSTLDIYKDLWYCIIESYQGKEKNITNIVNEVYSSFIVSIKDLYFLNGCVFIVQDLKLLVESVKSKGYIITQGDKVIRGQISGIHHFLDSIDKEFRNSLYYHNEHHSRFTGQEHFRLSRDKFSFRNIQMNLGNVRY